MRNKEGSGFKGQSLVARKKTNECSWSFVGCVHFAFCVSLAFTVVIS